MTMMIPKDYAAVAIIWDDLIKLVESNDTFFKKDVICPHTGINYCMFNYRLASFQDWEAPNALECRGIMFQTELLDGEISPVTITVRPPEKFFNVNENPNTMGLDFSNPKQIMNKMDGSLISTFVSQQDINVPILHLKSKGSLESSQVIDSMTYLDHHSNATFKEELTRFTSYGYTINLEYTAPSNRIVIGYLKPLLTVLSIRDVFSGEYQSYDDINKIGTFSEIISHWVDTIFPPNDMDQFIIDISNMQDIEGYVIQLDSAQHVKIKTEWYLTLHRAKDSINFPRRLYEAVLEESSDDLRSLFFDDLLVLSRIGEMEIKVAEIYKQVTTSVESFYNTNKHLSRKDYAILGQTTLDKSTFGLAMSLYLGDSINYKEFLRKHYREYGIAKDANTTYEDL